MECYFGYVLFVIYYYIIPDNLEFTFTEYCSGNHWMLKWNNNKWEGINCQGRFNSRVVNKWSLKPTGGENHNKYGCY